MNALEIFCCVFFGAGIITLTIMCLKIGRKR